MKHVVVRIAWTISTVSVCALFAMAGCSKNPDKVEESQKIKAKPERKELPEGLTAEQAAKVVAKVGDRTITVGDITRQINSLSPYIRRRWAAPEKRQEFLDKLIRVELLSQEAERLGLDKDPEVQQTVKQTMIRLMVKNDLEKTLLPSEIDEGTLKQEYEKEFETYHRPAQIRASQIVVKTQAEADKLLADLKAHKSDGTYFRDKARDLSIDPTSRERGGDLGYFTKPEDRRKEDPEIPAEVANAAWGLKEIGDIAEKPSKTGAGFVIVKLTNKRAQMDRSFESVKRVIESRVLRDKRKEAMDAFVDGLRAKAKIEMFPENIKKIKIDANSVQGDMMPNAIPQIRTRPESQNATPKGSVGQKTSDPALPEKNE